MRKYHLVIVRVSEQEEMLTEYDPQGYIEADSLEEAAQEFAEEFRIEQNEDGEEMHAVFARNEEIGQYAYSFLVEPCLEEDNCSLLENPAFAISVFLVPLHFN